MFNQEQRSVLNLEERGAWPLVWPSSVMYLEEDSKIVITSYLYVSNLVKLIEALIQCAFDQGLLDLGCNSKSVDKVTYSL